MVSATELSGSAVVGWVVRDVICAQVFCREVDMIWDDNKVKVRECIR